jgi:hypothetical protein
MFLKILNYLLIHNNLKKKKKMIEMVNGLFFKIGLNVLLLVVEEKCSFKEFVNPLLELVPLVKKDQKFLKKIVTLMHAQISVKEDLEDLQLKLEPLLLELKKFLIDLKDMNFVNSKKKMLKSCLISQELLCLSLTLLELY